VSVVTTFTFPPKITLNRLWLDLIHGHTETMDMTTKSQSSRSHGRRRSFILPIRHNGFLRSIVLAVATTIVASIDPSLITAAFSPPSSSSSFLPSTTPPSRSAVAWSSTRYNLHRNILDRRKRYTTSSLGVSELHVPGYAKTKLPFIHPDDVRGPAASVGPRTSFHERTYLPDIDYASLVPYQDGHLIHKTAPIFTPEECRMIIDEAEWKAEDMGWTTNRHGNYPTTDLPIIELPMTLDFLRLALVERIYPLLRTQFGMYLPDGGRNLRVADGFVVKYDANGGQTELRPHRDGSVLSFNIALNPMNEYDGGGTWFSSIDDPVRIDVGEMVTHSSSLLHGGHGITSGRRYIMVCFVILEGYDSWSMRFYNQVRNL
jgi:hypothetical protein